ncbi:MAG: histidine--tRNA ligase [Bacteroidota bacterium]
MSKQKPSIPKGTRDFGPAEMAKRHYILDTIKKVYQKYGYAPIETPAMENLSVLQGKYGDEGDQLLFKILDSGDFFEKNKNKINQKLINHIGTYIKDYVFSFYRYINEGNYSEQEYFDVFISREFEIYFLQNESSFTKLSEYLKEEILAFLKDNFVKIGSELVKRGFAKSNRKNFDHQLKGSEVNFINDLITECIDCLNSKRLINSEGASSSLISSYIAEKGLRYDLTVPFARFVVMNQHNLTFPFKRYQIQPVWRADRPQKGRYREFFQCDADAIGTNSMLCEAEIVLMIQEVFKNLQTKKANSLDYAIKINNRKILSGIVEVMGAEGKETEFAVAIDKLDKIGEEKVKEELIDRGFAQSAIDTLSPLFTLSGDNAEQMNFLKDFLKDSEKGQKGLAELNEVFDILASFGAKVPQLELDVTLARGLSYYTGAIFEVKPKNVEMGSICGGGRYDGLTDTFGLPDVSGVGISFGVDRIYDVLEELDLYPENAESSTEVLMVSFDEESWKYSLKVLHRLRTANVKAELYPEPVKLKKQMKYANDKQIPYVILVGSEEMKTGDLTFKNMKEGTQENLNAESILKRFLGYE